MDFLSIIFIAVALAMDAFSVSITKGFSLENIKPYQFLSFGLFFGGFQALMPCLGWISGEQVRIFISSVAPIVAFILLAIIGFKMIYDSVNGDNKDEISRFSFKELFILAIATSIDAFAVGVTFSILNTPILVPIITIGVVTFIFSEIGVVLGKKVGHIFGDKFEIIGGIILILLGVKIFVEGMGLL